MWRWGCIPITWEAKHAPKTMRKKSIAGVDILRAECDVSESAVAASAVLISSALSGRARGIPSLRSTQV
jgi:hypothetical protein